MINGEITNTDRRKKRKEEEKSENTNTDLAFILTARTFRRSLEQQAASEPLIKVYDALCRSSEPKVRVACCVSACFTFVPAKRL